MPATKRKAAEIAPHDPSDYYRSKHKEYMDIVGKEQDTLRLVINSHDVEQFRYFRHSSGGVAQLLRWPTSYRDGAPAKPGFRMSGKQRPLPYEPEGCIQAEEAETAAAAAAAPAPAPVPAPVPAPAGGADAAELSE